jgi:tRNA/tmRNA/rRNA uracil-C5-methylase (TrmA/RlmC/RlmD family)
VTGQLIGPIAITDVAHGGWGVGRWDGRVVFVSGTLPGETVTAEVTEQRSKLWFARTSEVHAASPDRVDHIWPLAATTGVGGADLGHVALPAQRRWKQAVLEQQLRRLAHQEVAVTVEAAPGDDADNGLGWRTRVSFTADQDGRLAMYVPYSDQLVAVDSMPLAAAAITAAAPWRERFPAGHRVTLVQSASGPIHAVLTPPAAGRSAAPTTADEGPPSRQPDWDLTDASSLVMVEGGPAAPVITEQVVWAGRQLTYQVAADGFWQVHRQAPEVLVAAVMAALPDTARTVFDLYAGAGLFAQPLAAQTATRKVIAVEGDSRAALRLAANLQAYPAARSYQGEVRRLLADSALPRRADAVVLDPPRAGAGRAVVAALAERRPDTIVYVACDPASLARDVALLADQHYGLSQLRAFDLFPHTHHIEAVAVFQRQ